MRYALLLVAAIAMTAACWGQEIPPLQFKGHENARVAVYIESLATGDILLDYNSDLPMVPASVMKSITSATAVSALAPDGYFATPVKAVGTIDGNLLRGDLMVEAVGDPTIESVYFSGTRGFADSIVSGLRRLGIDSITGRVIVDESRFVDATVPKGWQQEDLNSYYGTVVRGANYHGNASEGAAVKDPALEMAHDITRRMADAGIGLGGDASGDRSSSRTVYIYRSPKVSEILRSLMVRSDNMMAEAMLRVLSPGKPRQSALDYQSDLWHSRGVSLDEMKIYDGSGLSRDNRLTAKAIADVYRWMANSGQAADYAWLFPRAGQEGTMRKMLKDTRLQGLLATKTGSMSGIQCYGGYLLDPDGTPTHIVIVMVNGFKCPRADVRDEIERLLLDVLP